MYRYFQPFLLAGSHLKHFRIYWSTDNFIGTNWVFLLTVFGFHQLAFSAVLLYHNSLKRERFIQLRYLMSDSIVSAKDYHDGFVLFLLSIIFLCRCFLHILELEKVRSLNSAIKIGIKNRRYFPRSIYLFWYSMTFWRANYYLRRLRIINTYADSKNIWDEVDANTSCSTSYGGKEAWHSPISRKLDVSLTSIQGNSNTIVYWYILTIVVYADRYT